MQIRPLQRFLGIPQAMTLCGAVVLALGLPGRHLRATAPAASRTGLSAPTASPTPALPEFYIREYRVQGAHHLKPVEVEAAVYPFLGPGRTAQDVEQARAALLKAYQDRNYTSVDVEVPPQKGAGGIVVLQVNELAVGRLRVEGSRYYDIEKIKKQVPSLAEGQLIDFTQAQKELVGLNQLPDRRVTPTIRAGVAPGTMDVDLTVKDTLPLHGSLELNNRYSANTPSLRLDGSISYDNLWQLGHSLGASFQISPQDVRKTQIITGFYTFRFPSTDWLSITLQGTDQKSDVSTLGSFDSLGKGEIGGIRANIRLPTLGDYFHNFSFGFDYKSLTQDVFINQVNLTGQQELVLAPFGHTPTDYLPVTLEYSGTRNTKSSITDLDLQVVFNIRGIGSTEQQFDNARFGASGNFIYLRGDIEHTQDLPYDLQIFGKIAGQVSDSPLIPSEEFSIGGEDTVRGYTESAELGDNGLVANLELRGPSLLGWMKDKGDEWRVYVFTDAAVVTLQQALPEQRNRFDLASYGLGTRLQLFGHFNASLDLAMPVNNVTNITQAHRPFVTFRIFTAF